MRKIILYTLIFFCFQICKAQNDTNETADLVFWMAQKFECPFIEVQLFDLDSNLIRIGKLSKIYKGTENPDCEEENALIFNNIPSGTYYFNANCEKSACAICMGEGSYWQPTVQNKGEESSVGTRSKGHMSGSWKTCHYCAGKGNFSQIIWIDNLILDENQCRIVLLH